MGTWRLIIEQWILEKIEPHERAPLILVQPIGALMI
jgi:hypothetical protein